MKATCRLFTILFIILFIFSCKKTSTGSDPIVITFPDANLETLIREVISKPTGDILNTDLISIKELIGNEREIADISGVEYCTNLEKLELMKNTISDISKLSSLTNLTALNLYKNQISDISPISGLTNLTALRFNTNQISDIKVLIDNSGIDSGDEIWLENNPLSDTSINTYIPQLEARGVTVYQ